jgi:uncharacterized protein YndB with AHSA1/START domain
MLRILVWIMSALVVLVALIALVGWLLPVDHVASRTTTLAAPTEKVYAMVSRVDEYPAWWSQISRVEMLPAENGRTRFRQHDSTGAIVMEVVEAVPASRFVTRIADPDQPFGGTWTWEIAPEGSATRLTITERGEVDNPLFRFMARFVFGYTGTMDSFLAALTAALRTQAASLRSAGRPGSLRSAGTATLAHARVGRPVRFAHREWPPSMRCLATAGGIGPLVIPIPRPARASGARAAIPADGRGGLPAAKPRPEKGEQSTT